MLVALPPNSADCHNRIVHNSSPSILRRPSRSGLLLPSSMSSILCRLSHRHFRFRCRRTLPTVATVFSIRRRRYSADRHDLDCYLRRSDAADSLPTVTPSTQHLSPPYSADCRDPLFVRCRRFCADCHNRCSSRCRRVGSSNHNCAGSHHCHHVTLHVPPALTYVLVVLIVLVGSVYWPDAEGPRMETFSALLRIKQVICMYIHL